MHEPALRRAYQAAIKARIDWQPDEPEFHLFSLDVESAGYTIFEEDEQSCAGMGSRSPGSGSSHWDDRAPFSRPS